MILKQILNKSFCLFTFCSCFSLACRKTIEKTVEVEKTNSWTECKRFSGTDRIFLSSATANNALYFQQVVNFTELKSTDPQTGITEYIAGMPTDIRERVPISPDFFAFPINNDTLFEVRNTRYPVTSGAIQAYDISLLDPSFRKIQTENYSSLLKCAAINKNDVLLFNYDNKRTDNAYTFLAIKFTTGGTFDSIDTVFSRKIVIPRRDITFEYVRFISAIDDYFLVDIGNNGLYKIKEDGSFKRVYDPTGINAVYVWNNRLYAHAPLNSIFTSDDNAETWQQFDGAASILSGSQYFTVKDSLVGASGENLFSLQWNNNNYTITALKNDGLESTIINGVEVLNDTVYAATTAGLYYKPLSRFFDVKE